MVPPRFSKKTARMSTGGNAPRRVLVVRRQPRRMVAVLPRRSLRIARRTNVIDAVTESVLVHSGVQRPRRRRHKLTGLRSDGSRANRIQIATRAVAYGHALDADLQSTLALCAAIDARKAAEEAVAAAREAARVHARAEAQRLADISAAEQSMRADVERARAAALEAREVPQGPDPDETEDEDGIFSDYEPSAPEPLIIDLTLDDESDDDIQCGQPLSPLIFYASDSE
jgi:hypothetical protein